MVKLLIPGLLTSTLLAMTSVSAAELTTNSLNKEQLGVVSVHGKTSLSEVKAALQQKAEDAGASSYKIIAAGGNNQQFGVAHIYR